MNEVSNCKVYWTRNILGISWPSGNSSCMSLSSSYQPKAFTAGHMPSPRASPQRPVLCVSHPSATRDPHQVTGPHCGRPSSATSSGTRSPLPNFSVPSTVCSASNVPCPLPLQFGDPSVYVGNLGSLAGIIIPDSITQGNSEHCPLHCPCPLWVSTSQVVS